MSTFSVTNTNDSGSGSLRQAILDANALTGKNIINFNGVFADNIADTITLGGSSLKITDDLSIEGTGASLLTVSGNNKSRVLEISSGITVDLVGLTIANGYNALLDSGSFDIGGGGILNAGTLTVSDSTISGNSVEYQGGGIYSSGTLTIRNSTITNNVSGGYAGGGGIFNTGNLTVNDSIINDNNGGYDRYSDGSGGIYNSGNATVTNSTISNNSARFGGGIYNSSGTLTLNNSTISSNSAEFASGIFNTATATVTNSTISDNYADGTGGCISNSGTLTLISSTVTNNSAIFGGGILNNGTLTVSNSTISSNAGGGIYNDENGTAIISNSTISGNSGRGIYNAGTVTVLNSTIVLNNVSNYDYPDGESAGGGIHNSSSGSATVKNSIIAGNVKIIYGNEQTTSNSDVVGNFISNGFNLIGSLNGSTGFKPSEQLNVTITEVLDTTLRDNGGLVKTHALITGSPAINSGNNANVPVDTIDLDDDGNTTEQIPFDQRGSGFARISGGRVDIGAFEAVVNVINGTPWRNILKGTAANDIITGYQGRDILTGGEGADSFIYTSIRDLGDTIADFEVGTDKIVLRQLFRSFNLGNLNSASAISGGYLRFETQGNDTIVLFDPDGSSGRSRAVNLMTVSKVSASAMNSANNFAV
ncbi:MAG: right-handed parallel beta-helix repeat-containing protein [Komarekiella atlantica HA4396-MV6]|jgi:predicted outer membrane repeat protein|nr:right-handed parallel beta-helix repeat-containing protein [Komarekiella atlantica HA4396-MV6]